jgi:hypothetical protein
MKPEEMHRHILHLLKHHRIRHSRSQSRAGGAWIVAREVCNILPVTSEVSYATALHEIGHILGRDQESRFVVERERGAWDWARQEASTWTPAMEQESSRLLAEYETLGPRATSVDLLKLHAARARGGPD